MNSNSGSITGSPASDNHTSESASQSTHASEQRVGRHASWQSNSQCADSVRADFSESASVDEQPSAGHPLPLAVISPQLQQAKHLAQLQLPGDSVSMSDGPSPKLPLHKLSMLQETQSTASSAIGTRVYEDGSERSPRVQVTLRPGQAFAKELALLESSKPSGPTPVTSKAPPAAAIAAAGPAHAPQHELETAISIQPKEAGAAEEGRIRVELSLASYYTADSMRSHRSSPVGSPREGPPEPWVPPPGAGGPHLLLRAVLAPLKLKGDYCEASVLNASDVTLGLAAGLDRKMREVVLRDGEALRVLFAHMGLPVSQTWLSPCCTAVPFTSL